MAEFKGPEGIDLEEQARLLDEIEKEKAAEQETTQATAESEPFKKVAEEPPLEEVDAEEQARLLVEFKKKKEVERTPSQEVATKQWIAQSASSSGQEIRKERLLVVGNKRRFQYHHQ